MKRDKAQVTIFVIVAVLIVAIVALFFFAVPRSPTTNSNEITGTESLTPFVEECLKQVSEDAILSTGFNGGYYNLPEKINSYYYPSVAFLLYDQKNLVPSKEKVESEISDYVKENIDVCFDDFSNFKVKGFSVEEGAKEITTSIKENSVAVSAKIPLTISKEDSKELFSDFNSEVKPVRLIKILALINSIVEEQKKDDSSVCMSCLVDKEEESGMDIEFFETEDKNEFVYTVTDTYSNFSGESYQFNFAAKYNFPNCEKLEDCFK